MIPKIIHYCWFGQNELSDLEKMCIESWRKYCPDYSIKLWDESNSPMTHPWVRDSYKHKKYAFVSDYVRFYALNMEGGIYLDTDMLLVKSIDNFLQFDFFIGYEDEFTLSMGIIGAQKGNMRVSHFQKFYDDKKFNIVKPVIITQMITKHFSEKLTLIKNKFQIIDENSAIFPSDFFYPIHYNDNFSLNTLHGWYTDNTHGVHLWNRSWHNELECFSKKEYKKGLKLSFQRIFRNPILPFRFYLKVFKYAFLYVIEVSRNKFLKKIS